jgi:hypothetical protein
MREGIGLATESASHSRGNNTNASRWQLQDLLQRTVNVVRHLGR